MPDNLIKFHTDDDSALEHMPPLPAKKCIPDWYKNIENFIDKKEINIHMPTIKQCPPVTDMITSGYIIRNTYEFDIAPKKINGYWENPHICNHENYIQAHRHEQCPVNHDEMKGHYFKVSQPWVIRTPPGYSCLFVQPFYHMETRFQMMPAIVDTDKHDMPVLFTGWIRNPKEKLVVEPGTPIMQVIPFKRETWKSEIFKKPVNSIANWFLNFHYKNLYWNRKRFD